MDTREFPPTSAIAALFAEEIGLAGGSLSDTYNDGERLLSRSILPGKYEVRAGDFLQPGVALRASSSQVCVHPYVFRQICRNGAIIAHALQSRHIEASEHESAEDAAAAVREAVRTCCDEEAFATIADDIRSSRDRVADVTLNLLPVLSRLRPEQGTQIFRMIVERFFDGEDASRYGLMNAVTSVARDIQDPDVRWRLEELGGGVPVGKPPAPELDGFAAEAVVVR
jgi:hypothetical protein